MLTPLNNRVIVKRTEKEEKSSGGIVLPSSEQDVPNTGIVIAGATECTGIEIGNTVLFGNYAGSEIKLNGEKVLILKFDELIAKVG